MNLHPIFVHFPIAFLFSFCLLELFSTKRWRNEITFLYTKGIIVILGTIGTLLSFMSGEMAEHSYQKGYVAESVIEAHAAAGTITTILFSIISLFYLLSYFRRKKEGLIKGVLSSNKVYESYLWLEKQVTEKVLGSLLAFFGLLALFITGGLGGLLSHGPNSDIFTHLLYNFFQK